MFVCSRLWKLVLTGTLLNSSSTLNPTSSKHFLAIVDFGVVVAGGEIVEAGFGIVVITAITERVVCAKCSCQGAGGGYQLAPRIVDIFYHTHAASVHKAHYIILAVYKSRGSCLTAPVLVHHSTIRMPFSSIRPTMPFLHYVTPVYSNLRHSVMPSLPRSKVPLGSCLSAKL